MNLGYLSDRPVHALDPFGNNFVRADVRMRERKWDESGSALKPGGAIMRFLAETTT